MFGSRNNKQAEGLISSISLDELANIIRDTGYKAIVTRTEDGDNYIESANTGWRSVIRLFNKKDENYSALQFCIWLTDNDRDLSLSKVNDFNARWRYIKCTIDAGNNSVSLQYDVDLEGGVSQEFLRSRPPLWDGLVRAFRDFVVDKDRKELT